ncbi:MAG: 2-C-methyl-D-erythritol 4-phosphate cytidylyltransferase [Proteobacteria bacterium]|nr:2-C-methyl-D-erythritol 4-phosphate cytidylyltransferase [Pseudomonadota bacterium]
MSSTRKVYALIPAAGIGSRLSGIELDRKGESKVLIEILNQSLIQRNLKSLEETNLFTGIVIVAKKTDFAPISAVLSLLNSSLDIELVEGGASRQESVYNGLLALESKADIVAIHDGARPFCSAKKIIEVIDAASNYRAAILALPAKNSIKEVSPEMAVIKSIKREIIWEAQTPQVFDYELILRAHQDAIAEGYQATDDSELVERLGHEVKIVLGEENNIKVTTPQDIVIAKYLIENNIS